MRFLSLLKETFDFKKSFLWWRKKLKFLFVGLGEGGQDDN